MQRHAAFLAVLTLAAVLRAVVAFTYWPALLYNDSGTYLETAFDARIVGIAPDRPSGYPLLIHALSPGHPRLAVVVVFQHFVGLVVGILAYALLLRLGIGRTVATLGAGVVLLEGHLVALEQYVMSDTLFGLMIMASAYLAIRRGDRASGLAASGALLGAAATVRTSAVFAIPVWLIYMAVVRVDRRRLVIGIGCLLIPLGLYGIFAYHETGQFGLTEADGWLLYGRIAQIVDCRGADVPKQTRPLCSAPRPRGRGPKFDYFTYYVWNDTSPPHRLFGWSVFATNSRARQRHNRLLRAFSIAVIQAHPLAYARLVATDLTKFFRPGVPSPGNNDIPITLPTQEMLEHEPGIPQVYALIRNLLVPSLTAHARPLGSALSVYSRWIHIPRLVVALLTTAALILLLLPATIARLRLEVRNRANVFLLIGIPLVIALGSVATVQFVYRHFVPQLPLLVCGGLVSAAELRRALARKRARRKLSECGSP